MVGGFNVAAYQTFIRNQIKPSRKPSACPFNYMSHQCPCGFKIGNDATTWGEAQVCSPCVARAKSPATQRRENGPPRSFVLHPWEHDFTKANHPKKASFFFIQRLTRNSKASLARNEKRRDEYVPSIKKNFRRNALTCRFPCSLEGDDIIERKCVGVRTDCAIYILIMLPFFLELYVGVGPSSGFIHTKATPFPGSPTFAQLLFESLHAVEFGDLVNSTCPLFQFKHNPASYSFLNGLGLDQLENYFNWDKPKTSPTCCPFEFLSYVCPCGLQGTRLEVEVGCWAAKSCATLA